MRHRACQRQNTKGHELGQKGGEDEYEIGDFDSLFTVLRRLSPGIANLSYVSILFVNKAYKLLSQQ